MEDRNSAMNSFIRGVAERMRAAGVLSFLIKGQGVAQCYYRPLWRARGDVDLFLDESNYYKAQGYLSKVTSKVEEP